MLHIAGDFDMNWLDYEKCKKVQEFSDLTYENSEYQQLNRYQQLISLLE